MKNNIFLRSENSIQTGKQLYTAVKSVKNGENRKAGIGSLQGGQQITGVVESVAEQVILNFNGYEAGVSKDCFKDVKPGEVKTFEVVKATDNEVELKLLEDTEALNQQPFSAILGVPKDQDTFLSQKDQESKQSETERQNQETKKKMDEILTGITARDYQLLLQEGFPIESYTIDGLQAAINRVKTLENRQKASKKESMTKGDDLFTAAAIAQRLAAENLPASRAAVQKVVTALNLSETASRINDITMTCLIKQGAEPTIGNIYRAYYSGNQSQQEHTDSLTFEEWSELSPQAGEVIKDAGYEVNEENLEASKWLIDNGLPLTTESFTYKKELEALKDNISKEGVLDKIVEGLKNKTAPLDVVLYGKNYEKLLSDIQSIGEEAVTQAVAKSSEITIKNLTVIQQNWVLDNNTKISRREQTDQNDSNGEEAKIALELSAKTVKIQRQLQEIRLKMTLQAAATLEKKGFHIETEQLEKVVDALREMENSYYKEFLKEADVEGNAQNIQTLKETSQSLGQLKYIPEYVLGSTLTERKMQTIPSLLSKGLKLHSKMTKANEAYGALITVPNSEYGDSIQKAFGNIASILDDMDLENTWCNQRAVRILGYNSMEITEENIQQVKAYDLEVTTMIENLNPAVTVRMIKEGINPLDMPIYKLNQTIDKIKEEQGIATKDKFSTYLSKLERADGITDDQRKAYIGFYRLLHAIEKEDGAALGSVMKAGREVTLEHLLTAVRTSRKGSMNTIVDDEFGALESISYDGESITDQLNTAFTFGNSLHQSMKEDSFSEETRYMKQIIKQIREKLTPQKLQDIADTLEAPEFRETQTVESELSVSETEGGIWDAIKDVSIEKLLEMFTQTKNSQEANGEIELEKLQELAKIYKNSDSAVKFLNDMNLPDSVTNIMMAKQILSNEVPFIFKNLSKKQENIKYSVENNENSIKIIEGLADTLNDKTSMNEAYEALKIEASAALESAVADGIIDSARLAELKSFGMQTAFLKTLAQKEFYRIPVVTDKGITNINLTIIRGTNETGKVKVTLWSKQLGNVLAELAVKDRTLKGIVSGDNWAGLSNLKKNEEEITQAAKEEGLTVNYLDFGMHVKENEAYSYRHTYVKDEEKLTAADTERTLYHLAKAFVRTVRSTENTWSIESQKIS
jgi:hypothetical protein